MRKNVVWEGVFPAVTTQFKDDLSLDIDATARVMEGLIRDGVSGLIVCGTVGENCSLAKAEKIAITHMSINLVAVALFAVNIWLRLGGASNTGTPLILSVIAIAILAVSGWLGGEMVHRHGVGVDTTPRP